MEIQSKIRITLLFYMPLPHRKMYLYPLSYFLPSCRIGKMFLLLLEVFRPKCVLIAFCFLIELALLHFLYFEILAFPGGCSYKESTWQFRKHRKGSLDPWICKMTWRRKWQLTPVFLPGKSCGPRSLAGCSPWGS